MSEKELEHCGCGHEGCEHEDCDCCGEAEVVELLDDAGRKMSFTWGRSNIRTSFMRRSRRRRKSRDWTRTSS